MQRRWLVPVTGLALVAGSFAVVGGAAVSASASTGHARVANRGILGTFRPGGLFRPAPGTSTVRAGGRTIAYSTNWSGYAVTGSTFTTVSASWIQSAITCASGGGQTDMSPWVGIDGYSSNTVEQTGSSGDCNGATPQYYAWYEMYPHNVIIIQHTVKPGDKFTATVTHTSGTKYRLKLVDVTQGWTNTVTRSLTAKDNSAEAIMEMAAPHLSNFGTDKFTGVTVDGKAIGSFTASPYKIEQIELRVSGTICDTTSALSGEKVFTTTWKAAC